MTLETEDMRKGDESWGLFGCTLYYMVQRRITRQIINGYSYNV